jgi:hypothetical protein
VLAVTVMTCTRVAWYFDPFSTFEYQRSKVAMLERIRPSWQTTIVDGATWQRRSIDDVLKNSVTYQYMLSSKGLGRMRRAIRDLGADSAD